MIRLPGLIDPHVHLRDPGQTQKEDFYTGTAAALAGGFTTIIDMPNNLTPITTKERLLSKEKIATEETVCDIGFYFGSLGDNFDEFKKVEDRVLGLKVYLNQTTGNFIVDQKVFQNICKVWPRSRPILVHAEADILETVLEIGHEALQHIHVCHVSSASELQIIHKAKKKQYKVTCGVTPHHLFLTEKKAKELGAYGRMKPTLKSEEDVEFLWDNIDLIDQIESDHAPHTKAEKRVANPPFGVPGLETTLPLLLTAVAQGRITIEDILRLCYDNPSKIFGLRSDSTIYIEVDEEEEWVIRNEDLHTKCKWTPFNGWNVTGRVKRVFIRGDKVFENGKIVVQPGFGRIIVPGLLS